MPNKERRQNKDGERDREQAEQRHQGNKAKRTKNCVAQMKR